MLTTTATYLIAIQIASAECLKVKKYWITIGIVANLATLAYFKYANFGVDSFNYLIKAIGFEAIEMAHIILPIGLFLFIFFMPLVI